jgi:hypothetical protein
VSPGDTISSTSRLRLLRAVGDEDLRGGRGGAVGRHRAGDEGAQVGESRRVGLDGGGVEHGTVALDDVDRER